MSSRNAHEASDATMPTIAASTSSTMKRRLRISSAGSGCAAGAASLTRALRRSGLLDRGEGLALGLLEVAVDALGHRALGADRLLADALGVLVDADDDQRRVAGLEQRAELLGVAAVGPVREVSDPRAEPRA